MSPVSAYSHHHVFPSRVRVHYRCHYLYSSSPVWHSTTLQRLNFFLSCQLEEEDADYDDGESKYSPEAGELGQWCGGPACQLELREKHG
ncbi:hypothetical protein BRADI_2g37805v3 [Brachypodium distachyon]|uniref:Uncharacterized protein n=1 Tax=Brachypodium distachyon TaxID=15368 RepID=A0A2K2DCG8_BRADI|nr:hypothetical protein BRADI_2g37805v3 [Brachypodium distachyon]